MSLGDCDAQAPRTASFASSAGRHEGLRIEPLSTAVSRGADNLLRAARKDAADAARPGWRSDGPRGQATKVGIGQWRALPAYRPAPRTQASPSLLAEAAPLLQAPQPPRRHAGMVSMGTRVGDTLEAPAAEPGAGVMRRECADAPVTPTSAERIASSLPTSRDFLTRKHPKVAPRLGWAGSVCCLAARMRLNSPGGTARHALVRDGALAPDQSFSLKASAG